VWEQPGMEQETSAMGQWWEAWRGHCERGPVQLQHCGDDSDCWAVSLSLLRLSLLATSSMVVVF